MHRRYIRCHHLRTTGVPHLYRSVERRAEKRIRILRIPRHGRHRFIVPFRRLHQGMPLGAVFRRCVVVVVVVSPCVPSRSSTEPAVGCKHGSFCMHRIVHDHASIDGPHQNEPFSHVLRRVDFHAIDATVPRATELFLCRIDGKPAGDCASHHGGLERERV